MLRFILSILLLISPFMASSASQYATGPHISVELVAEYPSIDPDKSNWLGIKFNPDPEWHTYWQNPGDSGEAPTIDWSSSLEGQFGDIEWPTPKAIQVAHLVNYGYEGTNLLMVPFTLLDSYENSSDNQVTIQASVSWLVCKEDCIPGWADLEFTLPVASHNSVASNNAVARDKATSANTALFESTRATLPNTQTLTGRYEVVEEHISIEVDLPSNFNPSRQLKLMPTATDVIKHNHIQTPVFESNKDLTKAIFAIPKSEYFLATSQSLTFLLKTDTQSFYVNTSPNTLLAESLNFSSLIVYFLMALLGGLILNLMPCVLPVLSLKALGLTQNPEVEHSKWGYPIGVLISFNLFALVIVLLKESGHAVGWGFHMQEPAVIAFLAFLFLFIALMLLDLTPSGSRFAGIGQSLIQGNDFRSQFFTGVLAVVVASPCTAPFMAAALGVALVSDAYVSFFIFTGLGIGFALPLALIYFIPQLQGLLPKPGPWMERFKQFLVFPMLATVIWLAWVFLAQTNSTQLLVLLVSLLGFAFLFWASSFSKPGFSTISILSAILIAAYNLNQPSMTENDKSSAQLQLNENIEAFNPQRLTQLKSENKVVLINMTADWCITCKVNEQVAFQSQEFEDLINSGELHYLVGDWTNKNSEIFEFLKQYQRSGVPLYILYAGQKQEFILPQILTTGIILESINKAKEVVNHANI